MSLLEKRIQTVIDSIEGLEHVIRKQEKQLQDLLNELAELNSMDEDNYEHMVGIERAEYQEDR